MDDQSYEQGFEDGIEAGREVAWDEGHTTGYESAVDEYKEKISDIKYQHEKDLENSYKEGYNEAEEKYGQELNNIECNIRDIISQFQTTIKHLKNENYELRKTNAAITRTIPKSS